MTSPRTGQPNCRCDRRNDPSRTETPPTRSQLAAVHEEDGGQDQVDDAGPAPRVRGPGCGRGLRPAPREDGAHEPEAQGHEAREQGSLEGAERGRGGSEPPIRRRHRQVRAGLRRVQRDLPVVSPEPDLAADRSVRQEEGQEDEDGQPPDDRAAGDETPERRPARGQRDPGQEDRAGDGREIRLIARGQGLEREGARRETQILPAAAAQGGTMEPEEHEGQPLVAQHLDVVQLAEPEVREGVEHRCHRGRPRVARQVPHQPEHGQPGQGERGEPDEVVGQEHAGPQEAREGDERHEPEEVVGIDQRPAVRVKDVRVQEPERRRRQRVDVPREDPRRQEGVAQIDDHRAEVRRGRPRQDDGQRGEQQEHERALARASPPARGGVRVARAGPRRPGPPDLSHAPGTRGASGGGAPPPGGCRAPGRCP